jgi:hypothetical protein
VRTLSPQAFLVKGAQICQRNLEDDQHRLIPLWGSNNHWGQDSLHMPLLKTAKTEQRVRGFQQGLRHTLHCRNLMFQTIHSVRS